ncbi:MAG: biotin--[acetyl-CoA-carboxylase] ligase [Desulfurococcaceae archaeon TW002]
MSKADMSILSILLKRGLVSGESLAMELGVTRAYVHKVVDRLRKWGIPVTAVPSLGYYVPLEDDLSKTGELLVTTGVKALIIYLEKCVKSSQDIARDIATSEAESWTTIVCEEMALGRGRLGRVWYAPKGSLAFTIIIRPGFSGPLHLLSLAASISVAEALTTLLGLNARLKWPNDVLVNEKKVCGILVEGEAEADRVKILYLGIGINANNETPAEIKETATSLREIVGAKVPRATILAVVLSRLKKYYEYLSTENSRKIIDSWIKFSATIGKIVRVVTIDGREIIGRAITIDKHGRLVVEISGTRYHIEAGDVYHVRT